MTTKRQARDLTPLTRLYPLQFEPIYQYRLWGGRHLASLLSAPLPGAGPIGEAWLLSDREDHPSRIGAARLDLPEHLPAGASADSPEAQMKASDFKNSKP